MSRPGRFRETPFLLTLLGVVAVLAVGRAAPESYYARAGELYTPEEAAGPFVGRFELSSFILRFMPPSDAGGQKLAHRVVIAGLGALVAGVAGAVWLWPRLGRLPEPAVLVWPLRIGLGALVGWVGWRLLHQGEPEAGWKYLTGAGVAAAVPVLGRAFRGRRAGWVLGAAVAGFLLALLGPGAVVRVDQSFRCWNEIEILEAHYVLVLSPGDRLAAGRMLFDDISPAYGVLVPLLTCLWQKAVGPLSLSDYTRLIELLQVVYLLAAARAYYLYGRRKWVAAGLALAFVAIHYHFYCWPHRFGAPNHSPVRSALVPVTVLILLAARFRSPAQAAGWLGALAATDILFCWDVGVAATAGLIVFLGLRYPCPPGRRPAAHYARMAAAFAAGGAAPVVVFAAVLFAATGRLPTVPGVGNFLAVMKVISDSWFVSLRAKTIDPFAILIVAHAAFAVLSAWGRRAAGPVTLFHAARGAVGTMILVWFSYYANRPDPIYLWSLFVLYGFLLVDVFRTLAATPWRSLVSAPGLAAAAAAALVVVPHVVNQAGPQWALYSEGWATLRHPPGRGAAVRLQGVYFPPDKRVAALLRKAEFVKAEGAAGPVFYFTADSYLVPKLSGVWPAIPQGDTLWECSTRRQFEWMTGRVRQAAPPRIYFDSAESLAGGDNPRKPYEYPPIPGSREFHRFLRQDLSAEYEFAGVEAGWEVWKRKADASATARR